MTAADDLRQANFVAPSYASSLYAGVDKHFFFVLSNYLERGLQYGLLRHDLTPRPAYAAFAAVGHFLCNATIIGAVADGHTADHPAQALPGPGLHRGPGPRARSGTGSGSASTRADPHPPPPAAAYALSSTPGGGPRKQVLVVYCPASLVGQAGGNCSMPASLLADKVRGVARVYDMLGREATGGVPRTVSSSATFVVLPPRTSAGGAAPAPFIRITPPPWVAAARPAAAAADDKVPPPLTPSSVVLQPEFSYASNSLLGDSHVVSASGARVVLYVNNLGPVALAGTVNVTALGGGATVSPASWDARVGPGSRARLVMSVIPPRGRAAMAAAGTVELTGVFSEGPGVSPPVVYFQVAPDVSTLTPSAEGAVPRATDPAAWIHNIAPGGHVEVVGNVGPECVGFTLSFGPAVADAWAYPKLRTNFSADGALNHSMAAAADGLRFSLANVHTTPPEPPGAPAVHRALFTDRADTQYTAPITVNTSDSGSQEFTVLFKDAAWNYNGPAPANRAIAAANVVYLSIGLNLPNPAASRTSQMTLCNLRWVRF